MTINNLDKQYVWTMQNMTTVGKKRLENIVLIMNAFSAPRYGFPKPVHVIYCQALSVAISFVEVNGLDIVFSNIHQLFLGQARKLINVPGSSDSDEGIHLLQSVKLTICHQFYITLTITCAKLTHNLVIPSPFKVVLHVL